MSLCSRPWYVPPMASDSLLGCRQSNLFLMGHGPGGDLISRVKAQGSLTEMVTGTILSGCEQAGKGVGGNVLALSFADSEVSFSLLFPIGMIWKSLENYYRCW